MADGYRTGEEDFDEEDVWGSSKDKTKEGSLKLTRTKHHSCSSPSSSSSGSPRMIPTRSNYNASSATLSCGHGRSLGKSAPLNIPEWSKIYNTNNYKGGAAGDGEGGSVHEDCHEEDEDDNVPPHEWLARKMARSQISSFSVCEGAGRTLKGRDLSKVRNAVLTKTGFLE